MCANAPVLRILLYPICFALDPVAALFSVQPSMTAQHAVSQVQTASWVACVDLLPVSLQSLGMYFLILCLPCKMLVTPKTHC